uniref:3Beta_HSD domain-containing protein n=1 Tax=Caenorhabditis tropicalis TaxID=1561998 RepID=A0A1I7SZH1_9PELO
MAYLIVGGGGFLGANLVAALQENNDFTKLFILDPCFKLSQYTHLKINESNITWINGSFLDSDLLDEILPGIETVFHLSSIGHTGRFGASKHRDYVQFFNVTGTERLIEKCRIHHVKRFIYASSIAVCFVGKPIYDFSESDTLPPKEEYLDIYSETKADAEKIVRNSSTFEFRTTCLRFRAIYGPQDVCVAQKVVEMVRRNFLMFKISKDGRETISNMSSGQNCGVSMHLANQALMKNDIHGQVYNITDGLKIGQYTVWNALIFALGKSPPKLFVSYDLVSFFVSVMGFICFELFGCSPPLTRFELEVLVTDNTYSIEKAQKELGFNPEKDNFKQKTNGSDEKQNRKSVFYS